MFRLKYQINLLKKTQYFPKQNSTSTRKVINHKIATIRLKKKPVIQKNFIQYIHVENRHVKKWKSSKSTTFPYIKHEWTENASDVDTDPKPGVGTSEASLTFIQTRINRNAADFPPEFPPGLRLSEFACANFPDYSDNLFFVLSGRGKYRGA